jgi:glycosyltransferase involved in cell wall biosynthesis
MGHEVAVLGFWGHREGIIGSPEGYVIYPEGATAYSWDSANADTVHFVGKPGGLCISLMDSWVCNPNVFTASRWVPYFPIDHEPCTKPVIRAVSQAYARIVMSKFGERMMHDAGLDCYYAPHMIDCQLYTPQPQPLARQRLAGFIPSDKFVIGMVAANMGLIPSRKNFPQQIRAFAEFHKRHKDTHLYLHTHQGGDNMERVNLPELIEHLGIQDAVTFAPQYEYTRLNIPDKDMAYVYSAIDVLSNISMGEGFGIPIAEAQACGTPVIVGDWTAMSELCFSGWKIDKSDAIDMWMPHAAYQFIPQIGAIVDAYEQAYKDAGNLKLKKQARQGALAYDAETVTQRYWKPVLEELEQRIADEDAMPTFNELAGVAV